MEQAIEQNDQDMSIEEEHKEEIEEVNVELLNERMENIMKKLESLDVDNEIGQKEKNRDCRLIIDKIELENFKSYAGVKKIGPLHFVYIILIILSLSTL